MWIMQLAQYKLPSPSLSLFENSELHITSDGPLESQVWLHTQPLTPVEISKMCGLQLSTRSTNQGWVGNPNLGCWSWFEIAVYTKLDSNDLNARWDRCDLTIGEEIYVLKNFDFNKFTRWESHHNDSYSDEYQHYEGPIFDTDHEIWKHVNPGDVIAVLAVCQFAAWAVRGEAARLKFWELYDPQTNHDPKVIANLT